MMQPLPNITQAYRLLCQEENHRNLSESTKNSNEVIAFTTKSHTHHKFYKSQHNPRVTFNTPSTQTGQGRMLAGNKRNSAYVQGCLAKHICQISHGKTTQEIFSN